ncbi:MAG: DegT/DnrJ/EryC1/StrS family aminotransferase [Deltaproteobacteria bacterium]|nr:DegT/DnrJ/EryC1/StrS family aminotransferase [Deltaproteobacteria bacterium]
MTDTRVRFLDLQAQYVGLKADIRRAVDAVFEAQAFVLGPAVAAFETALGRYLDAPHVIGVASGTDALYLALRACDIGPGDAVLTTPYSFAASATQIARTGARPYFGDIERDSFNLDVAGARRWLAGSCRREGGVLRAPGGEALRAIVPVHLFGRPCAIGAIAALAGEHGLDVVEDAAQAIGARVDGRGPYAGTVGRFGCFSFYPTKNLGGAGDGGCVVARHAADADRVRSLARHGAEGGPYRHVALGIASRLDALQAAVLGVKLAHVDAWNAARRGHAERYERLLDAALGAAGVVAAPARVPGHVFHQYVVRVPDRDRVRAELAAAGIETQVYYPIPLHVQPCFAALGHRPGERPEAERAAAESLALPIYPELGDDAAAAVVAALAGALRRPGA